MIKLATVCSGIGAPEKALQLLGIKYELVFFSEIDNAAIRSYCSIHGENREKNLGDLSRIDYSKLPKDIDLIVGGTPCQDFSVSGLGKGGEEGSGTRSSLMWFYIKLIAETKPKIVVWENVAAVLNCKHYMTYRKFYCTLNNLGYRVNAGVLNAKYFNLPQNRVRVFVVAVRMQIFRLLIHTDTIRGYALNTHCANVSPKSISLNHAKICCRITGNIFLRIT